MGNRLIHFEFNSSDPLASVAFFEEALGWTFNRWGEYDYWLATTGEEEPGINGAVGLAPGGTAPYTINTVQVEDLEAAISACERAGGSHISEIMEIPGVGRWSRIREPGGTEFGIIQPAAA